MIIFDIAQRYARALFSLTSVEQMHSRSVALNTLAKLSSFNQLMLNPQIPSSQKQVILQKAISDETLIHFLLLLLVKKRLEYLSWIAKKFRLLCLEHENVGKLTIISAHPLDQQHKEMLKDQLEKKIKKNLVIFEKIAPEIIGGLIVIVDNTIFDYSIKGRLDKMQKVLLRAER